MTISSDETIQLPPSLKAAAARLAAADGVSLSQWVAMVVAQKVGAVETAAEFLKRRATGTTSARLRELLASAPDREPDEEDRLMP